MGNDSIRKRISELEKRDSKVSKDLEQVQRLLADNGILLSDSSKMLRILLADAKRPTALIRRCKKLLKQTSRLAISDNRQSTPKLKPGNKGK